MWKTLIDILFPRKCVGCKKIGKFVCDNCFSYIRFHPTPICPKCNKHSIEGATHPSCQSRYATDGLVSAVVYTGVIKRLVYQFKYRPYLSSLNEEIGKLMCESLEENEVYFNLLNKQPLLVSVPLYRKRLKTRGYNHAALLASYVAQYYNLGHTEALSRIRNTKPQFRLTKTDRSTNVLGAFEVRLKYRQLVKNRSVLVVDDIATTCSTLNEIAKVLKRAGAKEVWGVVFAREENQRLVSPAGE